MVNETKLTSRNVFILVLFVAGSEKESKYDERTLFCTKFWVKQVTFLLSKCTSFLLHSKAVQRNYLHFFKKFKTH